jgi:hypothetical protein
MLLRIIPSKRRKSPVTPKTKERKKNAQKLERKWTNGLGNVGTINSSPFPLANVSPARFPFCGEVKKI